MGSGKEIDWDALHREEEQRAAEEAEARSAYYASLEERRQRKDQEIQGLLSELGERAMAEEKARMEMEQAMEEKKALEAVRAKYRQKHGSQEWNSSEEDQAWIRFSRGLFGE